MYISLLHICYILGICHVRLPNYVNFISVTLGNTRPDLKGVGIGGGSDELRFKTYFLWKIMDKFDTVFIPNIHIAYTLPSKDVPVLVLLFVAVWFIVRGDLFSVFSCVIMILCFFNPFSIAITSLGEERANLSVFHMFVRFAFVWFCLFPLPLGVRDGLLLLIVALPGLFSYLYFFTSVCSTRPFYYMYTCVQKSWISGKQCRP